jgi:nucleotide-binding universal stress UspA family protein
VGAEAWLPNAGGKTNQIQSGSIVVAYDGSEAAVRAVHWAADQAQLERRHLTVVAVASAATGLAPISVGLAGAPTVSPEELVEWARDVADAGLAEVRRVRPGVEADATVVLGEAHSVLVALSSRAHMIVLGSRGHGPVRSKLLGSVSAAVSRDAACPVVVCRPHHHRPAKDIDAGVLVGADGTLESLPVIEHAFQQASLRGLPLTVVHCIWDVTSALTGPGVIDAHATGLDEQRLLLAESVAGFSDTFPEVHVDQQVARGAADQVLAAGSARWDLVVVGRHPVDTLGRRFMGAVSTSVVEHADTVVAVVPEAAVARL